MDRNAALALLCLLAGGWGTSAATGLTTLQNRSVLFPATELLAKPTSPLTNDPQRLTIASVTPLSTQGGRLTVVNTQAWARTYQGPRHYDQALALVTDRSNNVCITGYSQDSFNWFDFVTIKYAPDGTALWTNRYDGKTFGDFGECLSVDVAGNIYVSGPSEGIGDCTDVATIKYSPSGLPLWTNRYNLSGTNDHYSASIAADENGNLYVSVGDYSSHASFITLKYNSGGQPAWTNYYHGSEWGSDHPAGLAWDRHGHVVVTGGSDTEIGSGFATIQYAADGKSLWTNLFVSSWIGMSPRSLTIDPTGNIIVTGENGVGIGLTHVYAAVKYANDGTPVWTNVWTGPNYTGGGFPYVVADKGGNVFVTGGSPGANTAYVDYTAIKLSATGALLWTNRFSNLNSLYVGPVAQGIDNTGNLYVACPGTEAGKTRPDVLLVKYAVNGAPVWTNRFSGPGDYSDVPSVVALDGQGACYVGGYSTDPAGLWKYTLIKFADFILYTPPTNFVGHDTVNFRVTDDLGETTIVTATIEVLGPLAFASAPGDLGFVPDGFKLRLSSSLGTNPIVIYASTDLLQWQPLATNVPLNGSVSFLDRAARNHSQRFYRAMQLP